MLVGVGLDWDEEQDEEGGGTDQQGGAYCLVRPEQMERENKIFTNVQKSYSSSIFQIFLGKYI